jgi:hypothetical protein
MPGRPGILMGLIIRRTAAEIGPCLEMVPTLIF